MSRLEYQLAQLALKKRKAFIPFVVAGDPPHLNTVDVLQTLVDAGADVIELGMPFSDPMADGIVIQKAYERALASGMSVKKVLEMVAQFRAHNQHTPIVLMGYANPIFQYGIEAFARDAQIAGVDAVLIVDLEHHSQPWYNMFAHHGLHIIHLLAPTTKKERMLALKDVAKAYIYYVSLKGVTGAQHDLTQHLHEIQTHIQDIQTSLHLPVMAGFGIHDAQTAQQIAHCADGIVVGSKLVQGLYEHEAKSALHWLYSCVQTFVEAIQTSDKH